MEEEEESHGDEEWHGEAPDGDDASILVQHMHELLQPGGWVVTSARIWCQVAHRDLHKLASIVER